MPGSVLQFRRGYSGLQSIFRRVFHSYSRILSYERNILSRAAKILVVVSEAYDRAFYSIRHSKATSVCCENLETKYFSDIIDSSLSLNFPKDKFIISYIGGVTPNGD